MTQGSDPNRPQPAAALFDEDDDLAAFAATLHKATPRPDPAVKTAHLQSAAREFEKIHAAHQDQAAAMRPSSVTRPTTGWLEKGLTAMSRLLSPLKTGLVATTALVAVGLVAFVPETRTLLAPPAPQDQPATARAPGAEAVAPQQKSAPETAVIEAAPEAASDAIAAEVAPAGGSIAPVSAGIQAGPAPTPTLRSRVAAPAAVPLPAPLPAQMPADRLVASQPDTEAFANADANPVKRVAEDPVSTFSIDVDTASWSILRSSLNRGQLPPQEAVRVEEMVNYFPYDYAAPEDGSPFRPSVSLMETPWNPDTKLLQIGLQGALPAIADRPPLNLVFLVDTSGSMEDPSKLPLLKQSLLMLLDQLRPEDQLAIVAYAGSAGVVLEPTAAAKADEVRAALDRLSAGGATAGQEGLELAYSLAQKMQSEGDVSRILLATDGDFNVGVTDPEGLEALVAKQRKSGIYLSVLGFGRGNLDDQTMQSLAQNGNGTAAYIDTLSEARKVLVDSLSGALFPLADDVKIQVEFNPASVAEYRLIGYETRALRREDFSNDKVDAGEIGAGHQVTALYELTPVGSPALRNEALRYQPQTGADATGTDELGFLRLRYKAPGAAQSDLTEMPISTETAAGGADQAFAAAIAGFGQLLRGSVYLGDWTYADAIALASQGRGEDPYGYRSEALQLMRLAETLAD